MKPKTDEEILNEIFPPSNICRYCYTPVKPGERYCSEDCRRWEERLEKYSKPPPGYGLERRAMKLKEAIKILIERAESDLRGAGQGYHVIPEGKKREESILAIKVAWKYAYGWEYRGNP